MQNEASFTDVKQTYFVKWPQPCFPELIVLVSSFEEIVSEGFPIEVGYLQALSSSEWRTGKRTARHGAFPKTELRIGWYVLRIRSADVGLTLWGATLYARRRHMTARGECGLEHGERHALTAACGWICQHWINFKVVCSCLVFHVAILKKYPQVYREWRFQGVVMSIAGRLQFSQVERGARCDFRLQVFWHIFDERTGKLLWDEIYLYCKRLLSNANA